jgi:hypothetical protein
MCDYPVFIASAPKISTFPDSIRIKCFQLGFKPFLRHFFYFIPLISHAVLSVRFLRLYRIRSLIRFLTSGVTVDGRLERSSSSPPFR